MGKKLTPRQMLILKELGEVNLVIRNPQDPEVITEKALIFARSLDIYKEAVIAAAFKEIRETQAWMPALSDVVTLCNQHAHNIAHQLDLKKTFLPAPTKMPKEQAEINKDGIIKLRDALARKKGLKNYSNIEHAAKVRKQAQAIKGATNG